MQEDKRQRVYVSPSLSLFFLFFAHKVQQHNKRHEDKENRDIKGGSCILSLCPMSSSPLIH